MAAASPAQWNIYALPAAISLVLLVVETLFLARRLPETRSWKAATNTDSNRKPSEKPVQVDGTETADERLKRLGTIGWIHGIFLLFFSGVGPSLSTQANIANDIFVQAEFTLTFLTYDLFAASNAQNGRLLSCMSSRVMFP